MKTINRSSTGEPATTRFTSGLPGTHRRVQDLQWFENLFLLYVYRKVSKWGTVKFEGNQYHSKAANYFASLRKRQAELDRQASMVDYYKLKKEKQQ